MNKELISNFIRDFCAVGKLRAKSEVRRRLNEILKSQREEIVEKIEKGGYIIGKREGDAFKEEDTKEFINLIK